MVYYIKTHQTHTFFVETKRARPCARRAERRYIGNMKENGAFVNIDALGRLVVPAGIRKNLGITPDVQLELYMDGESIVIKKHYEGCIFCGSADLLTTFCDKPVCRGCIDKLAER